MNPSLEPCELCECKCTLCSPKLKMYPGGIFDILSVKNVDNDVDDKYNRVSQLMSFEVLLRRNRVLLCLQILNIVVLQIFGLP